MTYFRTRKMTEEQVDEARKLHDAGASWNALAKRFGVDNKTVHRAVDPTFRRAFESRTEPLNTEEERDEHRRRMAGDAAFKRAMLNARRWKRERFALGVDARPGTEHPRFMEPGRPVSIRSPAQWCAEAGSESRVGSDSY